MAALLQMAVLATLVRHDDPAARRRVKIGLSSAGETNIADVRAAGVSSLGGCLTCPDGDDQASIEAVLPALTRPFGAVTVDGLATP